ncbi:pyruvate, water dikinase regulatory protein [Halocella sp. SP3-1]|uniref:pyruvate, water dikinase regulatory protein n=1 Tax=Halocella sp. SP3-1 TaxID=2382161 RepID=UPI000F75ADD6|nr:pyruvate, water dikinase regulatory protein [Halocella sp. SP3-1]AZO94269.1 kinase/pyrophosphorylase [Halocella sp. SP3-1]
MTESTDNITIYTISDFTGKTVNTVVKSVMIQFDLAPASIKKFNNVCSLEKLSGIIEQAREEENPILAYTLVLPELCQYLEDRAAEYNLPAIDIIGPYLNQFSEIIDRQPQLEIGLSYQIDHEVFQRIECIDFSVRCDDGRDLNKLTGADFIIIGVSRTSKTPLSMYLAHQQYRVATISLSPEVIVPAELYEIPTEKIIGLSIDPRVLQKIRSYRVELMDFSSEIDYVKLPRIKEEIAYANQVMDEVASKIIDVSYKSIEEIAVEILRTE